MVWRSACKSDPLHCTVESPCLAGRFEVKDVDGGRIRSDTSSSSRDFFIPRDHAHGQRMEADFGKIYVHFPEGRRQVSVLILVWSCSNAPFAMALPTERTESIPEGMKQGFEFFGCIPREVWWDNPRTVAEELLIGRDRRMNPRDARSQVITPSRRCSACRRAATRSRWSRIE